VTAMAREIAEQPEALARTLDALLPLRPDLARLAAGRRHVLLVSVHGRIGGVSTFAIFGALAVVSFGYVWCLVPETKGRPQGDSALLGERRRWPEASMTTSRSPD